VRQYGAETLKSLISLGRKEPAGVRPLQAWRSIGHGCAASREREPGDKGVLPAIDHLIIAQAKVPGRQSCSVLRFLFMPLAMLRLL